MWNLTNVIDCKGFLLFIGYLIVQRFDPNNITTKMQGNAKKS